MGDEENRTELVTNNNNNTDNDTNNEIIERQITTEEKIKRGGSIFKFTSQRRKDRLAKDEIDIIHDILEACDAQEGVDIYQWCAFEHKQAFYFEKTIKSKCKYFWTIFKALICSFLQVFGLLILALRTIIDGTQMKKWCESNGEIGARSLAVGFSFYVAFTVSGWLKGLHDEGMYNQDVFGWDNTPWFINPFWITWGYTVNLISSIVAVWTSFFIIFFAESPFDIVINAVAVFFVLEIDGLLVHTTHYEKIGDFITQNPEIPEKEKKERGCAKKGADCCCKLLSYIVRIIYFITNVVSVVIPIIIGYCY